MKFHTLLLSLCLAASGFAADTTHKGYLADTLCAKSGHGMDGSDLMNAPKDHTVACQVACASGGYGLMVQKGTSYTFVPFDAKGNELALALLKGTKSAKAPFVSVMGSMKMDVLVVSSIKEAAM